MKAIRNMLAMILMIIIVCASGCVGDFDIPMDLIPSEDEVETTAGKQTNVSEQTTNDDDHAEECKHQFANWTTTTEATCTKEGAQSRACSKCGHKETQTISAKGHTEVVDKAVAATCAASGLTEGKHCSVCNETLVAQKIVAALAHKEVEDKAVDATCTATGLTAGKHCSVCNKTIVAQQVVPKTEHNYVKETVVKAPTCTEKGQKKLTCDSCTAYITQEYELAKYTASEIHDQALKYVGEIIVYDQQGNELGLATGFVYSSDGKIITNYHVIDGAYSAKITINGKTYTISQVLAYDKNIDLAVLKVNSTFTDYAKVCKSPVAVGSTVYAIGSSRGLTNTFSQGIVTYYDRVVDGVSHIQHDASITNGNSGGPLINEYGEVIGINSWLLTNSQNLNFAVFTKEIDNLNFSTAMTMAQFYQKECDVFTKMANYIMDNGTYNSASDYYYLVLGKSYSSDYSSAYTRVAYYYVDDNEISLDLYVNDMDYYVYFYIDPDLDGSYTWGYFDQYDYEMSGTLYASTFDSDTLLGYSYNNITLSSIRTSVRELASSMMSLLCVFIDSDFSDIGVTASDLLFYYF